MARTLKKTGNGSSMGKSLFSDLFDMDRLFEAPWMLPRSISEVPMVNVKETKDDYMLELAAPGMTKDDFDIEMDNHHLTISYEKEEEEKEEEANFTRREYNYNSFCRSFILPEDVDEATIDAKYENGMLKVMLPKKEEVKKEESKKRIAIK